MKEPENTLDEAEIAENDYVFLEVREQGRGWNFLGDDAPTIDKCEFCPKYEELHVMCACKKVFCFLKFLTNYEKGCILLRRV